MDTPTKICPVCDSRNEATLLECQKCGALLNDFPTNVVAIPDIANLPTPQVESFIDMSMIPEEGIGIYVTGTSRPYYLHIFKELIVGRPADATLEAVLDLSEFAAYAMGVSRRHVKILRSAIGFDVVDLNSRNGTWLNGERLAPHKSYPLASGSQLLMGKLNLLLVYHPVSRKQA